VIGPNDARLRRSCVTPGFVGLKETSSCGSATGRLALQFLQGAARPSGADHLPGQHEGLFRLLQSGS
jgi:hypothetical protein